MTIIGARAVAKAATLDDGYYESMQGCRLIAPDEMLIITSNRSTDPFGHFSVNSQPALSRHTLSTGAFTPWVPVITPEQRARYLGTSSTIAFTGGPWWTVGTKILMWAARIDGTLMTDPYRRALDCGYIISEDGGYTWTDYVITSSTYGYRPDLNLAPADQPSPAIVGDTYTPIGTPADLTHRWSPVFGCKAFQMPDHPDPSKRTWWFTAGYGLNGYKPTYSGVTPQGGKEPCWQGLLASADGLTGWHKYTTLDDTGVVMLQEQSIVYLGGGKLLGLGREDSASPYGRTWQFESTDYGATLVPRGYTNIPFQNTNVFQMEYDSAADKLVLLSGKRATTGNGRFQWFVVSPSVVFGHQTSWPAPTYDSGGYNPLNPDITILAPNLYFGVFGSEVSSSECNAWTWIIGSGSYNTEPALLTLDSDTHWIQNGSNITVSAPRDILTKVSASALCVTGGTMRFAGTNADRFTASLNGEDWYSEIVLSPGTTQVWLGVTPHSGDGALSATVGVWY